MKVIRRLLVTGVDTATRNVFGQTALLAAATTGHEAVIELLLTVGNPTPDPENEFAAAIAKLKLFDRNSENLIGQTPLSVAAERGHEGAVKLLIAAHGIEPDHKDVHGRTPLALASASGHQVVVKLLLATNRVDPDSKDSDGRTPLSTAAQNWHEKVVRLLLMARVDPTSKDTSGLTPLDWAKRGKRGRWNERVNQDPVIRLLQVAITERDRKKPSVYRPLLSIAVLAITIWSFW
jgi:ankyrin repeat protein